MEYPSFVAAFILCVILCYSAIIGKFAAVFQQCNYRADEYAKCFFSSLAEEWQKLVFCSACLCVYSLAAAAAFETAVTSLESLKENFSQV